MLPLFASHSVSADPTCDLYLDFTPYQAKYDTLRSDGEHINKSFYTISSSQKLCIKGGFLIGSDENYKLQTTFTSDKLDDSNKTDWINNPSIVIGACNSYSGMYQCYTPYTEIVCTDASCNIEIMCIPYIPTHYVFKGTINGNAGYDMQDYFWVTIATKDEGELDLYRHEQSFSSTPPVLKYKNANQVALVTTDSLIDETIENGKGTTVYTFEDNNTKQYRTWWDYKTMSDYSSHSTEM